MILVRRWVISVSLPFLLETSLKWGGQCSVWDENLPDWRSFELWPGCILHHNVCKNLPTTICIVKATVFPVVTYGCESWTLKKPECQRIDTFEIRCWRRCLRVPWTARRSNQSNLKEISLEYSLEWLMLKLKLQYFGHLMWRADLMEKTLVLGKTEVKRRRGWQRTRWWDA